MQERESSVGLAAFVLSAIVAVLLGITSLAGLLFGARGLYRPDPGTLPAFIGQDAITLALALPLLLGAMWSAWHGSLRGHLLWLGILAYLAYSYTYYLISPEFNALYIAYIAIVSMSGYSALYLLLDIDVEATRTRFTDSTPVRLVAGFLGVMAVLMATKWTAAIVVALVSGVQPAAKELGVWPMDLVIAFPAMFWGGVWLWRRQPLGYVVAAPLLVKAASVGLTLVITSWLVTLWGEPLDPTVPVYAAIGLGGAILTVAYLHSLASSPSTATSRLSSHVAVAARSDSRDPALFR